MDCQAGVVTGGDEVFLLCDKVQKGTNYKSSGFKLQLPFSNFKVIFMTGYFT